MLRKIITHPFFVFPVAACLFFWPLTFQLFTFKNDALTYYYPVRTLISDALKNGELPLWTPFINMGYPLHADMQSGAWNPVIWIFGLLGHYSLQAFHVEFLFYLSIAGIGFYYLCKNLGSGNIAAFTMALAYQFSGFMIDSVQFFNCISAAAYLPFIILFFRQTIIERKFKSAAALSFFLFLMFTGGYPSLFIITCYILVGYIIYYFFKAANRMLFIKQVLPLLLLSGLAFSLLSLPAIVSFVQHLPEIARGQGQSLATNLENSMNPSTMFSLLSPFSTTANNDFLQSSILMRSIYIGLIPLIFFIYAFVNPGLRQDPELRFYLIMSVIMLMMAWGEFFFLRQIAYYVLPLMNSFRHPALFRLFGIFFILLIAAAGMQSWLNSYKKDAPGIQKIVLSLSIIAILFAVTALVFTQLPFSGATDSRGKLAMFYNLNFSERYLLQLPFILVVLFATFYLARKKRNPAILIGLLMADLFFATQLNLPITVIGAKPFKEVTHIMNRNTERFPLPDNRSIEENINELNNAEQVASPLPYEKKIGRTDVFITPGNLLRQDSFYYAPIRQTVFQHPVVFFSGNAADGRSTATITNIAANSIEITASTQQEQVLILQQNYYKGWTVAVDGKTSVIQPIHISLMSVVVPAGKHHIKFSYHPEIIMLAFYIAAATFLILIGFFIRPFFSKRRSATPQTGN
ncbi:MAG: hypothetical protein EOO13_05595 [Chitinophagaceae bacterium]|nr:MAG: hypothetical protein EOO13_05595 [Chitinophagaceae bacterium]